MVTQLMGANARLCIKEETAYGVLPTGNWINVPFISAEIGATDEIDTTTILGLGRDPQRATRDAITVRGRLVVPLELITCGYWFKWMLGQAIDSGATNFTHLFQSGKSGLPSFALEFGLLDATVPIYKKDAGVVINTCQITLGSRGRPQLELGLIGSTEVEDNVAVSGTPTVPTLSYFFNKTGQITQNGSPLGKLSTIQLNYNNNFETIMYAGGGGVVNAADAGQVELTGQLIARLTDLSLINLAANATISDIAFGWVITTNTQQIFFEFDAADLLRQGSPIPGPGAIQRTLNIRGSKDVVEGDALRVTLINQQATY